MIIKNSVWGLGSYSLLLSIITCSFNRNNQHDRSTKKSSTFISMYYRDFYSWGKHENKWFNFIKCLMYEGKGNAGGRVSCSWTFEFCDYSEGSNMSWVSEWVSGTHPQYHMAHLCEHRNLFWKKKRKNLQHWFTEIS